MSRLKYEDLICTSQLFFCRLDALHELDPQEGLAGRAAEVTRSVEGFNRNPVAKAKANLQFSRRKMRPDGSDEDFSSVIIDSTVSHYEHRRRFFFVNCWHIADAENPVMWHFFASQPDAVAVVADVDGLRQAIDVENYRISFGPVFYGGAKRFSAFSKQEKFSHEKEYRVCIEAYDQKNSYLRVPCRLSKLIREVRVNPKHGAIDTLRELNWSVSLDFPVLPSLVITGSYDC